ncbi:MAG: hypothetical protein ACEQSK_06910 [Sphingomonadaceae bacterium]
MSACDELWPVLFLFLLMGLMVAWILRIWQLIRRTERLLDELGARD